MLPLKCRGGVIFLVVQRCIATAILPAYPLYVDLARVNPRCSNELRWGMGFCVPTVILVSASVNGAHYPNPTSNRDFKPCPNQSPALVGVSWGCCAWKHFGALYEPGLCSCLRRQNVETLDIVPCYNRYIKIILHRGIFFLYNSYVIPGSIYMVPGTIDGYTATVRSVLCESLRTLVPIYYTTRYIGGPVT